MKLTQITISTSPFSRWKRDNGGGWRSLFCSLFRRRAVNSTPDFLCSWLTSHCVALAHTRQRGCVLGTTPHHPHFWCVHSFVSHAFHTFFSSGKEDAQKYLSNPRNLSNAPSLVANCVCIRERASCRRVLADVVVTFKSTTRGDGLKELCFPPLSFPVISR